MSEPYVGEIRAVGFNFAPRGWALCDGQLLDCSQYDALFSLLGTTYGGDGRNNFALPDLRGRIPIHSGTGPGLSNRRIGAKGGNETVTLVTNEIPQHTHTTSINSTVATKVYAEAATSDDPTGKYFGKPSTNIYIDSGRTSASMAEDAISIETSAEIGNAGGGTAHSNMQPYIVLNYCIALFGIYPSRH